VRRERSEAWTTRAAARRINQRTDPARSQRGARRRLRDRLRNPQSHLDLHGCGSGDRFGHHSMGEPGPADRRSWISCRVGRSGSTSNGPTEPAPPWPPEIGRSGSGDSGFRRLIKRRHQVPRADSVFDPARPRSSNKKPSGQPNRRNTSLAVSVGRLAEVSESTLVPQKVGGDRRVGSGVDNGVTARMSKATGYSF
jgi:hypothetical protein